MNAIGGAAVRGGVAAAGSGLAAAGGSGAETSVVTAGGPAPVDAKPGPAPVAAATVPFPAETAAARSEPGGGREQSILDDTADPPPDMTVRLAEALSRNAVMLMLAQQTEQQKLQLRLDRIKAHFNASQEERAEMLREMNALRDMALEQAKKDDEVLKKYIAMI